MHFISPLRYDIYYPKLKLALEYDGEQHYQAIKAWGGEENLIKIQERDRRKDRLSKENDITIIRFKYDNFSKKIVETKIKTFLKNKNR